ncbi:MAG: hypothetical protein JWO19_2462 [Bryobacterales bacterium]|nr:hypothetical protein [Bryobacterales bacterium]
MLVATKELLLKSLQHYRGFVFRWQQYRQLSPEWNHDHCGGCWARFAEHAEEWSDVVHTAGWVTLWPTDDDVEPQFISDAKAVGYVCVPSPKLSGFQLDWLCPECFTSCHDELEFVVDPDHPQWKRAGV